MARPAWLRRFEVSSFGFPFWADPDPRHCAVLGSAGGLPQLFHWDSVTGAIRQLTQAANGVGHGRFDPTGEWLWWFAFTDDGDSGIWMRAPFDGGRPVPGFPGAEPGHPEGIGIAADGTAVAAFSGVAGGTAVVIIRPGDSTATRLAEYDFPAYVGGLSPDGERILLVHAKDSDPRRPALLLMDLQGTVLAELDRRPDRGVDVLPYGAPFHRDGTAIIVHEEPADGYRRPLLWYPADGRLVDLDLPLTGDLQAEFGAAGLLVHRREAGRSTIFRCALDGDDPLPVPTAPGTVHAQAQRPDGTVWYRHSSAESPPSVRGSDGRWLLPASPRPVSGRRVEDLHVRGPGGVVHTLFTRAGSGPGPTVFLLHGGPGGEDRDEYSPEVEAWADLGYHVVRINHRGSGGNGTAWRFAHDRRVGAVELADIEVVRSKLVATGRTDPARCVLVGRSWGGFLVLLGLGTVPELWAGGVAESPIADFASAYVHELEQLRALDRALFGGSPEEVPDAYSAASPLTYAGRVRAPLMIIFGRHDKRCPPGQIEAYIRARQEAGGILEVVRHDGGHGPRSSTSIVDLMNEQVRFVGEHVPLDAGTAGEDVVHTIEEDTTIAVEADITATVSDTGYLHVPGSAFRLAPEIATALRHFAAAYEELPVDPYLPDGGQYRRRRHARYTYLADDGLLIAEPPAAYYQSAEVNPWVGGAHRWFAPATPEIRDNAFLRELLGYNIRQFPTELTGSWVIDVHLVRILATADESGKPSPEGLHRDGFDFIALHLIGRDNVAGGRSTIAAPDGTTLATVTLADRLDSLYAEDSRVMHGAEPIVPVSAESGTGYRDMLLTSYQRLS